MLTTDDPEATWRRFFGSQPIRLEPHARLVRPALRAWRRRKPPHPHARLVELPFVLARITRTAPTLTQYTNSLLADDVADCCQAKADLGELWTGLIRRGLLDAELSRPLWKLHTRHVSALWLLLPPAVAAAVNRYETRYPGALAELGIPTAIGSIPSLWTSWLRN